MAVINLFKRIGHRIWSTEKLLLLKRDRSNNEEIKIRYEFKGELRRVTEDNVADCLALEDAHYLDVYREMLKCGDYGLFGYLDGSIVYRQWVKLSGELKCSPTHTIFFERDNAFIHYVYCDSSARGNGFHINGIKSSMERIKGRTFYATVKKDNYVSLHNFYRAGFSIESLLIVKNRFGIRIREEKVFNQEQRKELESAFLKI